MTTEQIQSGAWILLAAVITGVFSWLVARAKARADIRTNAATVEASVAQGTWERSEAWLNRLDKKVDKLQEENQQITAENRRISLRLEELWEENKKLHAENADQQGLIDEVAEYILFTDNWIAEGAEPPPPTKPQKIAQHVERIRKKYNH